ncbi:MAG: restriction endonuclease subunit S [Burkholderiaceae bacterium]|nr:restriction endonuclease subunit S [Aquabacterium sp.]NUP85057.1 restriction endonuclease subunit S [Burkholderiaceae bacterium]
MSSDELVGRFSIGDLIKAGVISAHKDGNFGSLYPRVEDFSDEGLPLLTAKVVNGGRIDFGAAQKLKREKAARLPYGFIQAGDVLLSHNATVGRVAVVPEFNGQALIGTSLTYFRLDPSRLLPRYLAGFLESRDFQNQLAGVMGLSTRNQVPITAQRLLEVEVPPLRVQQLISEFVGALDDRIALLRETNATLEAIAQALFKSWFVDFDPVRAKSQGLAPAGMDEATAALFPDGFEESTLGPIPRGWNIRSLDQIASYLNGLALQKYPPTDGAWLPVIKIAQLRKGDTLGADRAGRNIKPEYIVRNGDVLFSWSGSLEVEVWCGGEGALNQHLFKVTSQHFPKWFYFWWTRHHLDRFRQIAASKATTMGHIQRGHLSEAKVLVPPPELLDVMSASAAPLLDRITQNALHAQTLAEVRDTLLPRLISGQLRLPEAAAVAT